MDNAAPFHCDDPEREKRLAYSREYYAKNRDAMLAKWREDYKKNPRKYIEHSRLMRQQFKAKATPEQKLSKRNYHAAYARKHPEKQYAWVAKNIERRREISRNSARRIQLTPAGKARCAARNRKQLATPEGRINHRMSTAINIALKGEKNGRGWESLVGYSRHDLKRHLESLFKPGMTWEALLQGRIHIDHVIPKSKFHYSSTDDMAFRQAWAIENLSPEWALDNLSKGCKIIKPTQLPLGV